MTEPTPLQAACALPKGAKFYRCAFQVNPAHYAETFRGKSHGMDERTYVQTLLDHCVKLEIEVIAVTDHNDATSCVFRRSRPLIPAFPTGAKRREPSCPFLTFAVNPPRVDLAHRVSLEVHA